MELPKHGEFCWAELATNNLDGYKDFYRNVFGWEMSASKNSGIEMQYIEFNLPNEYPMGGLFDMKHIYGENPPPPHFMNYIAVDDVDAAVEKVAALGGECCHPPKDIPNVGRMVTIKDPTDAIVTLITLTPLETL